MAIEYKVIPRKILAGEDKGKVKYYATTSNTGRTDLDDFINIIQIPSRIDIAPNETSNSFAKIWASSAWNPRSKHSI